MSEFLRALAAVVSFLLSLWLLARIFGHEFGALLTSLKRAFPLEGRDPLGQICLAGTVFVGGLFAWLMMSAKGEVVLKTLVSADLRPSVANWEVGFLTVAWIFVVNLLVLLVADYARRR